MKGRWHKFRAPIDGKSYRFAMRCEDGVPKFLCFDGYGVVDPPRIRELTPLIQIANSLLGQRGGWEIVKLQHGGDIGAVIEAAEARRAEIYDSEVAA